MKLLDLTRLALANLWRSRIRTILTTLGVIVGIGALSSMISFGTGMQKNITDSFRQNDLFTSMTITSRKIDFDKISQGDVENIINKDKVIPLNDSVFQLIKKLPNIEIAFPEISFSGKLRFKNAQCNANIKAMPFQMKNYKPFTNLLAGSFYSSDTATTIIISTQTLRQLGINPVTETISETSDKSGNFTNVHIDSIIGQSIEIITVVFDASKFSILPSLNTEMPVKDHITVFKIGGILEAASFSMGMFNNGAIIPFETAAMVPRINMKNIFDLINNDSKDKDAYASIYVKVKDFNNLEETRVSIEKMGMQVFSVGDKLNEMKQIFLIFDSILGAVGTIALFVAALGIINTLLMAIMERRKEIGIMKAIGAAEKDIKTIFFVEAGVIGFIGGILGLVLGWMVTKLANLIANTQLANLDTAKVDLFYFPGWLLIGALLFGVFISLLSGLYPASKAAAIDPVEALRDL